MRTGMALSKLDQQVLHRVVIIVTDHTGIAIKEGTFRHSVRDITRQLVLGSDFVYTFGDFFKLIFARWGTKKIQEKDAYDILFRLGVELDSTNGLAHDSTLRELRKRIAKEAEEKLDAYLKANSLAVELPG